MFTKNNYHEGSRGTFNVVSTHRIKKLWNALTVQGFNYKETKPGEVFTFENKTVEFNYFSQSTHGSVSIYFIINNKQLLRISDHWSEGCKKLIVKQCGDIRSCYWKLQGNSFPFYLSCGSMKLVSSINYGYYGNPYYLKKWVSKDNCLLGGIININELKPR